MSADDHDGPPSIHPSSTDLPAPLPMSTIHSQSGCDEASLENIQQRHGSCPADRLPRELIGEIAQHAVAHIDLYTNRNLPVARVTLDTRSSPWKLAQISKLWRDVTLTSSELWTSLYLSEKDYICVPQNAVNILSLALTRSNGLPLSIYFENGSYRRNPGAHMIAYPLLDILIDESYRWKSLEIIIHHCDLFAKLQEARGNIPSLEYLHVNLHLEWWDEDEMFGLGMDMFEVAPRLRTLVTDMPIEMGDNVKFPFANLESYSELGWIRARPHTLAQFTNIVDLVLRGVLDTNPDTFRAPIELPTLRTLRAEISMLGLLISPSVQYLDIDVGRGGVTHLQPLDLFLTKSRGMLTSLRICGFMQCSIVPILRLIPNLTSLRMLLTHYDPELFRSLVRRSEAPRLLPCLETLTLEAWIGHQDKSFDIEVVFQLLESRRNLNLVGPAPRGSLITSFLFCLSFEGTESDDRTGWAIAEQINDFRGDDLELLPVFGRRIDSLREDGLCVVIELRWSYEDKGSRKFTDDWSSNWPFVDCIPPLMTGPV